MNDRRPLLVAVAAAVLMLGRPIAGDALGMELDERVLIVAALVFIALAAAARTAERARSLLGAAIATLVATTALLLSSITPTGAVLLVFAIGSLVWQRRALAST